MTPASFTFRPGGYANHTTPLIRNTWYVAGLSNEISRNIISRRFLGVEVALYRTLSGEPVAVRNRCPHRSFPLAMGRLEGDVLVCGYHGMQFDPGGRCLHMPSMPIAPANANVRTFPVAEKAPLVWIWMGNPDKADEDLIPDTHWLSDTANWTSVGGSLPMNADYVSMHENLLDQTHFPFLHPGTVGTPAYARSRLDVQRQGDSVLLRRVLKHSEPPGIYGIPAGIMHKKVDRYSDSAYVSPAMHRAFAKIVDPAPDAGQLSTYRFTITHLITPEHNGRIHYWWFNSRDFALQDQKIDAFMREASIKAYTEDVVALEAIGQVVQNDLEPQQDLNFGPDKPGLMMRTILHELAAAEAGYPGLLFASAPAADAAQPV